MTLDRLSRHAADLWAGLRQVQQAPFALRLAVRSSAVLLVVLLPLWSMDRLDLTVYATFGAFASVYGGGQRWAGRWRLQAALGAVLTLAVISGVVTALSDDRRWLAVVVSALWAGLAATLSDRHRWAPPGPVFAVFAVATCSAIPTDPRTAFYATAVAAATAALAVAVGALEVVLSARLGDGHTEPRPATTPVPPLPRQRVQRIRCGVAVLVAGVIATASSVGHPYWAMVAAVVPLSAFTLPGQVVRGLNRALGTLAGLAVAAGLLVLDLPDLAVLVTIAALQGVTELLVPRHYGAAMVSITPLALLSVQLASPEPTGQLLLDRLLETIIGVAVGITTAIVTRSRSVTPGI